jgi:hypothetical protein
MTADIYRKPVNPLDTLSNGFPTTQAGLEIRLLK